MERQEITIGIPYIKAGKEQVKKAEVSFISNGVISRYNRIALKLSHAVEDQEELQKMIDVLAGVIVSERMSFREKRAAAKPLKVQINSLKKKIKESDHKQIMKDRFDLIQTILEQNGNTDEELKAWSFWNDMTEPATVWKFLTMAVTKDAGAGKKKVNTVLMNPS